VYKQIRTANKENIVNQR